MLKCLTVDDKSVNKRQHKLQQLFGSTFLNTALCLRLILQPSLNPVSCAIMGDINFNVQRQAADSRP